MKNARTLLFVFLSFYCVEMSAQHKEITLEDLWINYKYYARHVSDINWMQHGSYFTSLEKTPKSKLSYIVKYDVNTGDRLDTLVGLLDNPTTPEKDTLAFTGYRFSKNEDFVLLKTAPEKIFRHSTKAAYFLYDLKNQQLQPLSDGGKQLNPSLSPDGQKIAFTRDNNLFIKDFVTGEEIKVTHDGEMNTIINGRADWVYEEEFSFTKAFFWSPNSRHLAFYRFDESEVPEYNMQWWGNELYPENRTFKYPKAGEKNSEVKIFTYDLASSKTTEVFDITGLDAYIPRVEWTKENLVSIQTLNRWQNEWTLIHTSVDGSATDTVLTEKNNTYVEITDPLTYLDAGSFIRLSEKNGYNHLYLHKADGQVNKQLTSGKWEVSEIVSVDEKNKTVYFMSTQDGFKDRCLYKVGFDGKGLRRVLNERGYQQVSMSPDHSFFIATTSTFGKPFTSTLRSTEKGKTVRVLEDNKKIATYLDSLELAEPEFFSFKANDTLELNGYMIKPKDFIKSNSYPVLMYVYGGPGHQTVINRWGGFNYMWYQLLAAKGYIVVSVDGRGTGGRGENFKKCTYGELGKYETVDQIAAANYLGSLPYVDKTRIGIWGWSFGGYLSSLALLKGADLFKMGIAVAPVTSWRFYDTIYTERYLKTPQVNPKGYDDNSPIMYADRLKGNFLLIHGTGDDNVHFQNAIALQNALVKNGKQFDSFYYPDRNHHIYGGLTRYHLYQKMTNFIVNNL